MVDEALVSNICVKDASLYGEMNNYAIFSIDKIFDKQKIYWNLKTWKTF